MLEIALSVEAPWPDAPDLEGGGGGDWTALATRAAVAAVERTPHGPLVTTPAAIEISVRLADDDEVRALNAQYRGKDRATNVLSFPMVQADLLDTVTGNSDDGEVLLGDIVLAHGVCVAEAAERCVSVEAHATHLLVHGCLHLLGYDHGGDAEAEAMEAIERDALASLGIADPYAIEED